MANNVIIAKEKINEDLLDKGKQVYILSIDTNSKRLFFVLLQYKVRVSGFVVKDAKDEKKLYGVDILSLDETKERNPVYVVNEEQWDFFCGNLDENKVYFVASRDCQRNEFIFREYAKRGRKEKKCNAALMLTMILSRIPHKQAVFLVKAEHYDFWANLVEVLKGEICDAVIIPIDIEEERIYDLMYYDRDKLIVFVCVFDCEEIFERLIELDLKQTQHFVFLYNSFSGNVTDKYCGFDWYLGNTFRQQQDFPGFYIHGDPYGSGKKVVLLGNSAADPLFYPQKSWPEMLYEMLTEQGMNITVYNGAVTDYNSSNEVIKLFRDVLLLKPDIVISYSGIIDFRQYVPEYPYININLMRTAQKWEEDNGKEVIYGLADKRSAYERWLENEKIMQQICQMKGITFWGILQPWLGSGQENAWEKLQIWSDHYWQIVFPQFESYIDNVREFKERIREDVQENVWLYDFTDIFLSIEDSDIYFDSIHVNEYGNRIVAEKFNEILSGELSRIMRE